MPEKDKTNLHTAFQVYWQFIKSVLRKADCYDGVYGALLYREKGNSLYEHMLPEDENNISVNLDSPRSILLSTGFPKDESLYIKANRDSAAFLKRIPSIGIDAYIYVRCDYDNPNTNYHIQPFEWTKNTFETDRFLRTSFKFYLIKRILTNKKEAECFESFLRNDCQNPSYIQFLQELASRNLDANGITLLSHAGSDYVIEKLCQYTTSQDDNLRFIHNVNHISALAYEGASNCGSIAVLLDVEVYPPHEVYPIDFVQPEILFTNTIPIENTKQVRKLCEIAAKTTTEDTSVHLLSHRNKIHGIANLSQLKESNTPFLVIQINGPLQWEILEYIPPKHAEDWGYTTDCKDETKIQPFHQIAYDNGSYRIKQPRNWDVSDQSFDEIISGNECSECDLAEEIETGIYKNHQCKAGCVLKEKLGSPPYKNQIKDTIRGICIASAAQRHGTTLVFSIHAADEALRLSKTCFLIKPISLIDKKGQATSDLIQRITAIDGAVLCDFEGNCYAIGVILDGMTKASHDKKATPPEDISRGARYNSAIRYKNAHPCAIICIVSEDGYVNIL